jgi:hypothetical protein
MSIPQTLLANKNTIGITNTTETGEAVFLNTTTNSKKLYLWTCPDGVYEVSAVCVGAGGGGANSASGASGGGGGGLGWKNYISVTPNTQYTIVVGGGGTAASTSAGAGYSSYFISTSTVAGYGGSGGLGNSSARIFGGSYVGDGGGNGGITTGRSSSIPSTSYYQASGGGGAGGYTGVGGTGGMGITNGSSGNGYPGQGGGGGGGSAGGDADTSGAGGGVGLYGKGLDGNGGTAGGNDGTSGTGGSGGENGAAIIGVGPDFPSTGGNYGGGGGASDGVTGENGPGGNGAVRLIWGPRYTRAFPDSDTTALGNITTYSSPILYNSIENLANYMSNYMTEYRQPSFYSYTLGADSSFVGSGGANMYSTAGNFTTPWQISGTTYVSNNTNTASFPNRIFYNTTTETIVDTNFKYASLGHNTGKLPLTVIGTRNTTGNPIGWQKGGKLAAGGFGLMDSSYVYNGDTINGFTVYAFVRQVYFGSSSPTSFTVCDIYILLGHTNWNSTFGTITAFGNSNTGFNGGWLYTSGAGVKNILAITNLLSQPSGAVTSGECQTVVQNIINRVKLYFGY